MPSVLNSALATTHCKACGTELPANSDRCPGCGRGSRSNSSRITLAVTLIVILAGFAFTQSVVRLHRATEAMLAQRWFTRGEQAMQARIPAVAADDYRTALTYDPENRQYRLHLAQALLAANRLNEAKAHLISLWEQEPADGEVNLTLARLHARRGDYAEAQRYYANAINGVWTEEPRKQRIATRFELVRYLLEQHDLSRARAELLALEADGPSDEASQLQLGQLLLQINEPSHAIEAFDSILSDDPKNPQAWLGKGLASLQLGRYDDAEHALARTVEYDPKSVEAQQQLEVLREVLRLDASAKTLSLAERTQRVAEAFRIALKRLSDCAAEQGYSLKGQESATASGQEESATQSTGPSLGPTTSPPGDLQMLYTSGLHKEAEATERALRRNPDLLEPTMQYVFEVERTTAPVCRNMQVADHALLILAQHETGALR